MTADAYLESLDLLDTAEVNSVKDQLNVSIDADSTYRGEKVPFAYNYIDLTYRVTHDFDTQGEHGSHVAGISAANTYIKSNGEYVDARETTGVCGVAPDAQLIIMKVFGEAGGAYTSDYMAAIEDAIILGADSINLSLGSSSAGFSYAQAYEDIMQSLKETDAVVTISAGNSYAWSESVKWGYLYKEDVRFATGGSPGSYSTALTVASVNSVDFNSDGSYTEPDYYTMSNFSSWGVPESLELKPELTAPGGNIYSVNGIIGDGKQYESMSGTSMAAPQMAGMAAVMAQYIRENDLTSVSGLTNRQLATSLLMSTAHPLKNSRGLYYSVMRQGSGMAVVSDAVSAKSYIKMGYDATEYADDGKVKAELGEDADRTGEYSFSFTLNNLTGSDSNYRLSTDLFTQDLTGDYLDYDTTALAASFVYTVDGKTYVPYVEKFDCDLNGDGITDALDAKVILAAVLDGTTKELPAIADVDNSGTVDTYDAHLLLANLVTGSFELPANGKVTVTVAATLTEEQKTELDDNYPNGAYVEGFTYVESADGSDVTHSIPILAFYGNWSDPDMFGVSYTDILYGDEREPYFGDVKNNNLVVKSYTTGETYLHTGNPYLVEDSYPADRAAVNSSDVLSQYKLSLLRNAAAMRLQILDENGNQLYSSGVKSYINGAYNASGSWKSTNSGYTMNVTPASLGLKEGDSFTVEVVAVPEYYTIRQTLDEDSFDELASSNALGHGSTISVSLKIDNTLPQLYKVQIDEDESELLVSCSDDNYVAAIMITDMDGNILTSVLPTQTKANERIEQTLSLDKIGGECLLVVGDYAQNQVAYVLNLKELAKDDPSEQTANVFMYEGASDVWHQLETDADKNVTYSKNPIPATSKTIMAAEYVDGYVYQVDTSNKLYVAPQSEPSKLTMLADLSSVTKVQDMAFNVVDKQLYLLGSNNTIYTVDTGDGHLTKQFTVSVTHKRDNMPNDSTTLKGLAIDDEGRFIVANYAGTAGFSFFGGGPTPAMTLFVFTLDQVADGKVENLTPFQYDSGDYFYFTNGSPDKSISLTYDSDSGLLFYVADSTSFGFDMCILYTVDLDTSLSQSQSLHQWPAEFGYICMAIYSINESEGVIVPPTQPTYLTISSSELSLTPGDSAVLTYEIGPWNLENTAVVWSSNNKDVATVEDGVVTAVAQGNATITVTSEADPTMFASCAVKVLQPGPMPESVAFQGLIYGDDSQTYWSEFASDDTENWTAVQGPSLYFYGGVLSNGEIIAHSDDVVYTIDPDTFEYEALIDLSTVAYWNDAAPAEDFDAIAVLNNNGTRFGVLNAHTGDLIYKDLSEQFGSDHMTNIALYNSGVENDHASYDYYVITESGKLYTFSLTAHEDEGQLAYDLEYTYIAATALKQPGVSSGKDGASSSMLYDEESGYLYVTSYVGTKECATLYAIWPATGTTTELGSFGEGVWPVNSLYRYEMIKELTLRAPDELQLFKGDEYALKATVLPTSMTGGVILESSNADVVDVDGTTLIAVAPGDAVITVTTVDADEHGPRSKEINVTVLDTVDVDVDLNAMVTTKDDRFYWSSLDTENLNAYDVINESLQRIVSGGAHNGKLYVNDGTTVLYYGIIPVGYPLMIDPLNDFDATSNAWVMQSFVPTDLTTLPVLEALDTESDEESYLSIGNYPLNLSSSDCLVLLDFEGGSSLYWGFDINDLGGHPGALTYDERVIYEDKINGGTHDAHSYYLLTDTGMLHRMYIYGAWEMDAYKDYGEVYYKYTDPVGYVGMTFEDYTDMSMVRINKDGVDGLVVASGNGLYFIDLSGEELTSGKIGSINDASRISVLYTDDEINEASTQSIETVYGSNSVAATVYEVTGTWDTDWVRTRCDAEPEADGSLNAVKTRTDVTPNSVKAGSAEANTETVTVTLTETMDVTNGLITVTYDPSVLTFDSVSSGIQTNDYRVDAENGVISFAYASAKATVAGKTLATVKFTHELDKGILDTTITLDTIQRNNEVVDEESEVITFNQHLEHSYAWTLVEEPTTESEGKLSGSCDCGLEGSTVEVILPVLSTEDYDYEVVVEPTYDSTGKATFTWKNTEYGTWVFEVEIPALTKPVKPIEPSVPSKPSKPSKPAEPQEPEVPVVPDIPVEEPWPFVDVTTNDWFYSNVDYVYTNGLMSGVDANHFDPNAPMTRAMLWTVLARLDGVDTSGGSVWYEKGQLWAMENGISDGTDPNGNVTREQLVTMLWRYAGSPDADESLLNTFSDASEVSSWARAAMAWAIENSIINGSDGKLMPASSATRAQVAAILNRYCVNILK